MVQALVTLLAKITKYGWFDTYKNELIFQNLLEDVKTFLQVNVLASIHIVIFTVNGYLVRIQLFIKTLFKKKAVVKRKPLFF